MLIISLRWTGYVIYYNYLYLVSLPWECDIDCYNTEYSTSLLFYYQSTTDILLHVKFTIEEENI